MTVHGKRLNMASRLLGGRLSSSGKKASSPSSSSAAPSTPWFETQFDTYKDVDEQSICPEGVERFCQVLRSLRHMAGLPNGLPLNQSDSINQIQSGPRPPKPVDRALV